MMIAQLQSYSNRTPTENTKSVRCCSTSGYVRICRLHDGSSISVMHIHMVVSVHYSIIPANHAIIIVFICLGLARFYIFLRQNAVGTPRKRQTRSWQFSHFSTKVKKVFTFVANENSGIAKFTTFLGAPIVL